MRIQKIMCTAAFLTAGHAFAIEHSGGAPAAHMELKDRSGTIVCIAYDTDPGTVPVASDCPAGNYTEQLFDITWSQIGERSIEIGGRSGDCPPAVAELIELFSNTPYVPTDQGEPFDQGGGFVQYEAPGFFGGTVQIEVRPGAIVDGEVGYLPPIAAVSTSGVGTSDGFIESTSILLANSEAEACATLLGF